MYVNLQFMWTETSHKEQLGLARQTPLQMGTMTYSDEAAPGAGAIISWELMAPSSDDSDDISSRIPLGTLGSTRPRL
jgi:hypothetical protein